jgi:hypothetical protein
LQIPDRTPLDLANLFGVRSQPAWTEISRRSTCLIGIPDNNGTTINPHGIQGRRQPLTEKKTLTMAFGIPVAADKKQPYRRAPGPVLMPDVHLLEKLAPFDREHIPLPSATVDKIRQREEATLWMTITSAW